MDLDLYYVIFVWVIWKSVIKFETKQTNSEEKNTKSTTTTTIVILRGFVFERKFIFISYFRFSICMIGSSKTQWTIHVWLQRTMPNENKTEKNSEKKLLNLAALTHTHRQRHRLCIYFYFSFCTQPCITCSNRCSTTVHK